MAIGTRKPGSDRKPSAELPVLSLPDQGAWETWLDANHDSSVGVWLRFAKRGSTETSLSYREAVEVALCFGWIDGQAKGEGDPSWLQKYTPRTKKSIWSKINRERALALAKCSRMKAAGLKEIERAKADGRWEAAYDSPSAAVVPEDLQTALNRKPLASAFFEKLDSRNRHAILFRIHTAKKPETRARRIEQFAAMLEKNEKLHP